MTQKFGTGAEAWFSYDENGRMLTQDDATGHMAYLYAPKSYRVTDYYVFQYNKGLGGMAIRKMYREKARPEKSSTDCGMFGFTCEEVINVYDSYNNNGTMDYAEIEAELNSEAHENSEYWFDAPAFY